MTIDFLDHPGRERIKVSKLRPLLELTAMAFAMGRLDVLADCMGEITRRLTTMKDTKWADSYLHLGPPTEELERMI